MNKTENFYFVKDGDVAPPERTSINGREVTSNPFGRPNWIGDSCVGVNTSDETLVSLNVFRLWTDIPTAPEGYYTQVYGQIVVESDRVIRTDTWQAIDPSQIRDEIISESERKIKEYTSVQIMSDPSLKWNTDYDIRSHKNLVADLSSISDEELINFDRRLESHPPSDIEYAKHISLQEVDILITDTTLRDSDATPLLSDDERTEMKSRVSNNSLLTIGEGTTVMTPSKGAARELVTLHGEGNMNASFAEITFDWNTTPYYIPEVIIPTIPEDINVDQLFAMVHDQDNVYRSWMPFEEVDGKWKTPSNVSYISIGKTESSVWRVAVAFEGTSSDYEITGRVRLVPPDIMFSLIRWGGRT